MHLNHIRFDRSMILPAQNTPLTKLLRMTTLRFLSNFITFVQSANYQKIKMNNVTVGHFINYFQIQKFD